MDYSGLYDRIQEKYPNVDEVSEQDIRDFIYHGVRGKHTVKWGFSESGRQRYKVVYGKRETMAGRMQIRKIYEYVQEARKKSSIEELPSSRERWDFGTKNIWYDAYNKNYIDVVKEAVNSTNDIRKLKSWDRFEDPEAARIIKNKIRDLTYSEGEKAYVDLRDKIFTITDKSELLSLNFDNEFLSDKQIASLERARKQRLEDLEKEEGW